MMRLHSLLLIPVLIVSIDAIAAPCVADDFQTTVSGQSECLLMRRYGPSAQGTPTGEVTRVATRENVTVPIYAYWQNDAVATVVLFSGGAGGYGAIGEDGWPAGGNFLIRTGKRWVSHAFNIVMIGRPSDGIDLSSGNVRIGDEHAADNAAILKVIKQRSPVPIWVVGTSMGTISAAAAAIRDEGNLIAGVVLTSAIVAYKVPGAVPRQPLENVVSS